MIIIRYNPDNILILYSLYLSYYELYNELISFWKTFLISYFLFYFIYYEICMRNKNSFIIFILSIIIYKFLYRNLIYVLI